MRSLLAALAVAASLAGCAAGSTTRVYPTPLRAQWNSYAAVGGLDNRLTFCVLTYAQEWKTATQFRAMLTGVLAGGNVPGWVEHGMVLCDQSGQS